MRNSLSGGPNVFNSLSGGPFHSAGSPPFQLGSGKRGAAAAPTPVGDGRLCQNLFTDDGQRELPDELLPPVPKENA